jgi:hypothetical protein
LVISLLSITSASAALWSSACTSCFTVTARTAWLLLS